MNGEFTMSNKLLNAGLVAGAVSLAVSGIMLDNQAHAADKEKCYGVVKAGHNDCANASGTHSCEGQAQVDGHGGEWVAVPKGLCERLVGGSTEPYEGTTKEG